MYSRDLIAVEEDGGNGLLCRIKDKLRDALEVNGIWFGHTEPLPANVSIAFRLNADEWNGVRRVKFLIEGAETEVRLDWHKDCLTHGPGTAPKRSSTATT